MGQAPMTRLWTFVGSALLHAGALGLFLLRGAQETPRAALLSTSPALALELRAETPLSFDLPSERPDVLPLADAAELELTLEREEGEEPPPPRFSRSASRQAFDRPLTTPERVPAPEVKAEEAVVEIYNPPPAYPASARRRGHEGHALLEVKILRDGSVADARVVESSGSPLFADAALEAVRAWRYAPPRAERAHRVRFTFKLRV